MKQLQENSQVPSEKRQTERHRLFAVMGFWRMPEKFSLGDRWENVNA